MKNSFSIALLVSIIAALLIAGCGPEVPVAPKAPEGTNPYVQGSPEERIKNIEADPTLTPEEKTRRIQVIKERNGLN